MTALDGAATGEDRAHLLRAFATPDTARVLDHADGSLGGFVVRAPWGGGATIAPGSRGRGGDPPRPARRAGPGQAGPGRPAGRERGGSRAPPGDRLDRGWRAPRLDPGRSAWLAARGDLGPVQPRPRLTGPCASMVHPVGSGRRRRGDGGAEHPRILGDTAQCPPTSRSLSDHVATIDRARRRLDRRSRTTPARGGRAAPDRRPPTTPAPGRGRRHHPRSRRARSAPPRPPARCSATRVERPEHARPGSSAPCRSSWPAAALPADPGSCAGPPPSRPRNPGRSTSTASTGRPATAVRDAGRTGRFARDRDRLPPVRDPVGQRAAARSAVAAACRTASRRAPPPSCRAARSATGPSTTTAACRASIEPGVRVDLVRHQAEHDRHPVGDDEWLESLRIGDRVRIGRWSAPFETVRRYLVTGQVEAGRNRALAHDAIVTAMTQINRWGPDGDIFGDHARLEGGPGRRRRAHGALRAGSHLATADACLRRPRRPAARGNRPRRGPRRRAPGPWPASSRRSRPRPGSPSSSRPSPRPCRRPPGSPPRPPGG